MKPNKHALFGALLGAAVSSLVASTASAANQEPAGLNLGLTSFYDGFGRNDEGFVYLVYGVYSRSRSVRGDDGHAVPVFNDPKIDSYALINQLVYVFPEELFGGAAHPGFMALLPLVAFDTSFAPPPPEPGLQLKNNKVGFGDLTFGPFIQFKPIKADNRPVFSHRIELDLVAPIGAYNPNRDINQGANFASFNPYWAMTVLPIPHLEISARFHYLFNFKNNRPANPPPIVPAVVAAQAGQAFWVNYTASYEVIEKLHVGVNGYYFKQFTDDNYTFADGTQSNGKAIPPLGDEGQAQFLTVGPGLFWDIDKENKLWANAYFTVFADNRPSSTAFNLHYIHDF
ncbi:MAG TPA: transporter [Polyangiaceae bacterium]|nr:transporter [Polyangiaceae bacterium]